MSLFSVGGNAGFALAPVLITPAVLVFGLSRHAASSRSCPPLVAVALAFELPHLRARSAGRRRGARAARRATTARTTTGARSRA